MVRTIAVMVSLVILASPLGVEDSHAQTFQGLSVGRAVVSSDPPSTDDWLFVLEILARGGDGSAIAAADATVCIKGEGGVVRAIYQLYQAPIIGEEAKGRLLRPLEGLQRDGAVRELSRIMMDPDVPPDHPISVAGGRRALRVLGPEGARVVVEKLKQWGELPLEEDMDSWAGMDLATLLAENPDPQNIEHMLQILEDQSVNSGARLGAACSLLGVGQDLSADRIASLIAKESNPVIKECLERLREKTGAEAVSQDEL